MRSAQFLIFLAVLAASSRVAIVANAAPALSAAVRENPTRDPPLDELAGVKVGMTLAQLRSRGITITREEEADPEEPCSWAEVKGLTDVQFMLDGETVARIDVFSPAYATLGGVRVGQSEAEVRHRLGDRVKVEPHPYTGPEGHYLVVHAKSAPMGLILETDGKKVLSYRIGRWEPVQWIEGCL